MARRSSNPRRTRLANRSGGKRTLAIIGLIAFDKSLLAVKVGGDTHFRSAHQPIRVPGTVYHKHGHQRLVQIREHRDVEVDLADFAEKVAEMPPLPGAGVSSPSPPGAEELGATVPAPGALCNSTRQPRRSASRRTTASPMPMPSRSRSWR